MFSLDYTLISLISLTAVAFIAGLARGFSGFGAGLIFVPMASALLGSTLAVPLVVILEVVATLGLIPQAWQRADKREVGTLMLGALVGVPLGTWFLTHIDPLATRWIIAGSVFPMLILLLSGWRYHGKPAVPVSIGVGAVSGLFSGFAQVGGPPVIAYWLGGPGKPESVRANLILYFIANVGLATITYIFGGLFVHDVIVLAFLMVPIFIVGLWLGTKMFGLASEQTFRRVCYTLIALSVIVSLPILDHVLR